MLALSLARIDMPKEQKKYQYKGLLDLGDGTQLQDPEFTVEWANENNITGVITVMLRFVGVFNNETKYDIGREFTGTVQGNSPAIPEGVLNQIILGIDPKFEEGKNIGAK